MSATTAKASMCDNPAVLEEAESPAMYVKRGFLFGIACASSLFALFAFLPGLYTLQILLGKFREMFQQMNVDMPGLTVLVLQYSTQLLVLQTLLFVLVLGSTVHSYSNFKCGKPGIILLLFLAVVGALAEAVLTFLIIASMYMPLISIMTSIGG